MERLILGLVVLGLMLTVMVAIAWLAIRESRREYDQEMRRIGEHRRGRRPRNPAPTSTQAESTSLS